MPCDTVFRRGQTITERKVEIKKVLDIVETGMARNKIKPKVSPKGGVTFEGLTNEQRDDVTDACVYRMLMRSGSALTRHLLQKAVNSNGGGINRTVVNSGHHSHDGGRTWHDGH